MTFDEILAQVIALLQREKRVSYRVLQRRFNILVPAHRTLGTTLVHFGEFTAARAHLELRAAMSLTRPWQRQGKRAEAHQLLAEVYGWCTEGFDTTDLQEAKTRLDALA